jgi:hypothetical protein
VCVYSALMEFDVSALSLEMLQSLYEQVLVLLVVSMSSTPVIAMSSREPLRLSWLTSTLTSRPSLAFPLIDLNSKIFILIIILTSSTKML